MLGSYVYDAAGNPTNDDTTSYSYNALNWLIGTSATGQARGYTYNGGGTLMAATANSTTTTYVQDLAADMSQVLASTTGGSTTDYLYGNEGEQLGSLNAGTRTWYGVDGQGSIRQLLTDSGTVTGAQDYDPFGSPEDGTLGATFGYAGQLQDPTTGAEYLRARWYQPSNASLLGVDPALASTDQPYAYAGDSPATYADPTGLDCQLLGLTLPFGSTGQGSCVQQASGAVVTDYNGFRDTIRYSDLGRGSYDGLNGSVQSLNQVIGFVANSTINCVPPDEMGVCGPQWQRNIATFQAFTEHPVLFVARVVYGMVAPYSTAIACGHAGYAAGRALGNFGPLLFDGLGADALSGASDVDPLADAAPTGSGPPADFMPESDTPPVSDSAPPNTPESASKGVPADEPPQGPAVNPSRGGAGNPSQADPLAQARAARDAKAAEVGRARAAVTGGYNRRTGEVVAGCSGNGFCAEDDVVRQLGGDPSDVQFTEAIRPRTGRQQPICQRCQGKYTPDQFPSDVWFEPEGPWSNP